MSTSKKLIVGNWKMYGNATMALPLVENILEQAAKTPQAAVVLCPPATLIHEVARAIIGSNVWLGGQDCHSEAEGAFTGDISAAMLKDSGCSHVIVGHSERRAKHQETNEIVRSKAAAAMKVGMVPIICIGETLAEREAGKAEMVVKKQIEESLPKEAAKSQFILAYEPVWAIGTGKTPTNDDIANMHTYIVSQAAAQAGLAREQISVLYGGSVKSSNARDILAQNDVSGVLVGGASLKADEFCAIIAAA